MSAALTEVRFASSGCSKHAMIRSVAHMAQMHPATDVVITTATIIHVTSYTYMVYWSFFVFNYMLLETWNKDFGMSNIREWASSKSRTHPYFVFWLWNDLTDFVNYSPNVSAYKYPTKEQSIHRESTRIAVMTTIRAFCIFMLSKRRFWTAEQSIAYPFLKEFQISGIPKRVLKTLKSASKTHTQLFVPQSKIFVWGA